MTLRAALLLLVCCASPALGDVPERLEAAFTRWAEATDVTRSVIVVSHKGAVVRRSARGRDADTPIELASLSKSITAVCAATLIDAGAWTLETTSAEILDAGPAGITVADLLTHRSGLGPDRTQLFMHFQFGRKESTAARTATLALARDLQTGQRGEYLYNNENYAIMGEMIAAETGQSYVTYCRDAVINQAGLTTAGPSPRTGAYLPYAGWQMSAADYARFHWQAYGPGGVIGMRVPHWPRAVVRNGADYGMGMLQRSAGARYAFWHFGGLCLPLQLGTGALVVLWPNDWSVVVGYDICATDNQMIALERVLSEAVSP